MALPQQPGVPHTEEAPPPFLGSWRNVYVAISCYLVGLIVLFYLFRKVFEP